MRPNTGEVLFAAADQWQSVLYELNYFIRKSTDGVRENYFADVGSHNLSTTYWWRESAVWLQVIIFWSTYYHILDVEAYCIYLQHESYIHGAYNTVRHGKLKKITHQNGNIVKMSISTLCDRNDCFWEVKDFYSYPEADSILRSSRGGKHKWKPYIAKLAQIMHSTNEVAAMS